MGNLTTPGIFVSDKGLGPPGVDRGDRGSDPGNDICMHCWHTVVPGHEHPFTTFVPLSKGTKQVGILLVAELKLR